MSDKEYTPALLYRTYRLLKPDNHVYEAVTQQSGVRLRQIDKIYAEKFSGRDPLKVISFLSRFKRSCDTKNMYEGEALVALSHQVDSPAYNRYLTAAKNIPGTGGFLSFPTAVNYLLSTYAQETVIEPAVEALEMIRQKDGESKAKFMECVRFSYTAAGGIHD